MEDSFRDHRAAGCLEAGGRDVDRRRPSLLLLLLHKICLIKPSFQVLIIFCVWIISASGFCYRKFLGVSACCWLCLTALVNCVRIEFIFSVCGVCICMCVHTCIHVYARAVYTRVHVCTHMCVCARMHVRRSWLAWV